MSMRAQELRQKRAKCVADARAIIDQAEKRPEGERKLNADEERQYQAFMSDVDGFLKEIEREERLSGLETEMRSSQRDPIKPTPGADTSKEAGPEMRAFRKYLRSGRMQMSEKEVALLTPESGRALSADADIEGGYLVAPKEFVNALLKNVDDLLWIRQLATKYQVPDAASLGVVSLDSDPEDFDWTTEIAEVDDDSAMTFGDRELKPHPLTKGIKVSNKLMRMAMMNPEQLVQGRLAYKNALTQEKAFLTGSGSGRPLGVFTASNDGVPTSRDVSTGNTSTSITPDGLIEAKYSLKQQYWTGKTGWLFHRDAVKQVAKAKDGDGQYLWQPSIQMGQPDKLLNFPVYMSENAPSTFTSGLYVGMLADWSFYWIADAMSLFIQRLDELYARTRQTGFICESATDGMPVLAEAFVRVKLG